MLQEDGFTAKKSLSFEMTRGGPHHDHHRKLGDNLNVTESFDYTTQTGLWIIQDN